MKRDLSGFLIRVTRLVQGKVDGVCASELILTKLKKKAPALTPISIIEKPIFFVEPWEAPRDDMAAG